MKACGVAAAKLGKCNGGLLKDKGKGPKAGKPPISDTVRLAIVTKTAKES